MSSRVNLTSKNKAVSLVVLLTFATAYRNKNVDLFLNNLIVLVCNFCFSNSTNNKANIFLGLIEYELNSLLGASHLVDYISIHIRFDLERYLLNIYARKSLPSIADCAIKKVSTLRWFENTIKTKRILRKNIMRSNGSIEMLTIDYYMHPQVQVLLL